MSKKGSFYFNVMRAVKKSFFFLLALSLIQAGVMPRVRAADNILYVKPGSTGDCSSWGNACALQAALTNAVSGKQIWVAAGTYKPSTTGDRSATFQLKDGVAVYGGFAGTEASLDQRNWTTNVVTLSGDLNGDDSGLTNIGENSYHVVTGTTGATLDGVTISHGYADGDGLNDRGGGMLNNNSSPILVNLTFSGNSVPYYSSGGGMANFNDSNPTLINVTFSGNGGGGMRNDSSSPTLTNVIFSGNKGAGISNRENSSPTLSAVTFSGNSGGGMRNDSSSPTLTNVTFSDNSDLYGAGMINWGSSPTLTNVTFNGNTASINGGGMFNIGSSPTLINVTFSSNTAGSYGGGMFNGSLSNPTLINVTFSNNAATDRGSGLFNESSNPTLINSILWDESGGEIYNDNGSTPIINFSDIQGGYPGTGNINVDPLLAPLGNYGGEVQTLALLPGSPVIDAASGDCPTTDARGLARSSPNCDMGAFESQGFTLARTDGDNQSTPINSTFTQPLCVAMTANYAGEPVDGAMITFSPPASGASAILFGSEVTITNGEACASAWANGIDGSYDVTASTSGKLSVTFSLTNNPSGSISYLPILVKPAKMEPGLSGKVTMNSASAPGVPLDLRFYNGSSWSTRASTTTSADGSYTFNNIPALGPGQSYYVLFLNDSDPSRLAAWWTPEITTYNTTSIVIFDPFDIANVELSTPRPGASVGLPVTFSWNRRPATPTDSYEFNLFDPQDDDPWFYTDPLLGYVGSYKLENLPAGFAKGVEYGWGIYVYSPDGGGGMSYYYYIVKFN